MICFCCKRDIPESESQFIIYDLEVKEVVAVA